MGSSSPSPFIIIGNTDFELKNGNGTVPGAKFFAAYVGPSMNPTLREPEIMEIMPYKNRPLRVGDVAFFLPPESVQPVVHRIIRLTPAGISTLLSGPVSLEVDRLDIAIFIAAASRRLSRSRPGTDSTFDGTAPYWAIR